jgi:hypothetical protein
MMPMTTLNMSSLNDGLVENPDAHFARAGVWVSEAQGCNCVEFFRVSISVGADVYVPTMQLIMKSKIKAAISKEAVRETAERIMQPQCPMPHPQKTICIKAPPVPFEHIGCDISTIECAYDHCKTLLTFFTKTQQDTQ